MPAKRCSICALNYPVTHGDTCGVCLTGLDYLSNAQPSPDWESRENHAKFERWCEENERE